MAKDLFKAYRFLVPKSARIEERKKLAALIKTDEFQKWFKWALKAQRGQCFYCDTAIRKNKRETYHIEHRIPVYRGGKTELSNLVLACPDCNITKGTDQLIRNKGFLRKINSDRVAKGLRPKLYT